ncbi:hypothetical protein ACIP1U_28190 [Cupriavidus sp. NPDC089707]|uniref:hypothetical protein n=1 Tax=Cupriavidus sp. NPDC089707 TaxID=3363963 RepID=UPI00380EF345
MSPPELTPIEKVRIARTNVTHEPKLPGCVDCEEKAPIRAVILSPNLGTPLVLPPGQTQCSIFIAAEAMAAQYFGVGGPAMPVEYYGRKIIEAKYGPVFVDRHLRVYPIQGKETAAEPKDTMLFQDGKAASRAMAVVKVWQVGRFLGGLMVNHSGDPVVIIRPETVRLYKDMAHVYEIQIDLATLPDKPDPKAMHTFAWMVPVPARYAQRPEVKGVEAWEYQDQVILDFLEAQAKSEAESGQNHYPRFYEYDVSKATAFGLPPLKADTTHRLMAWHPVIQKQSNTLKLGHLSDVHVNVRHLALQKSLACLIETASGAPEPGAPPTPRASAVCNSFLALRDLIGKFGKKGCADALVITGDLIDFNRNIVSGETGDKPRWVAEHMPSRADKQGLGILSRATQSISDEQKILLQAGKSRKRRSGGSLTVFSHFTIVNYDGKVALSAPDRQIEPQQSPNTLKMMRYEGNAGGWNLNNLATCGRNVDWYFRECVAGHDQTNNDKVDYHLSGHSHRAGVYTVGLRDGGKLVQVRSAFDPGLSATQDTNKHGGPTKLIVSSSGGPLGTQNLNGELGQWLLTAPSGTLLNEADSTPIQQVRAEAGHGKPRLAVALDYLFIDKVETPLVWLPPANGPLPPTSWTMLVGPLTDALQCIDKVRFWVFMAATKKSLGSWSQIDALIKPATDWRGRPRPGGYVMAAALPPLLARFNPASCRMFCEVFLKEPTWPKACGYTQLSPSSATRNPRNVFAAT